jgi:hypothetical protein
MKKSLLSIFAAVMAVGSAYSQANVVLTAPPVNSANGTTGARAPNGTIGHTVLRAQYFVPAAELTALSPTVSSFGFVLVNGVNAPASGTITVYLQNTGASSYTAGTTWNTTGMTTVYTGTYNIPATANATVVDLPFPVNFNFTNGALNVAYEYTAAVTSSSFAVYSAFTNSAIVAGATGASSTIAAPSLGTTTFRPLFRFGTPNTVTNDIGIDYISTPGLIPANTYSTSSPAAVIRNNSNTSLTNIAVGYSITGVTNTSGNVIVPSLAAGATTMVTLTTYTIPLSANGSNNISVGVLPDQNNSNNIATRTVSLNCNAWGAGPSVVNYSTTAVGFNQGSGIIYSRFNVPTTNTLTGALVAISTGTSNGGNSVYAVLANATGSVLATSNTVMLVPSMYGTYQTFTFATTNVINANTDYHIGIAQPANSVGYFPLASFTTAVLPPNLYATASLTSNVASPLTTNLGYLGLQAQFAGSCGSSVGFNEISAANSVKFEVYPNPASNSFNLVLGTINSNMKVEVINALGQVVVTRTNLVENNEIDIQSLAKGVYFVKVTSGNESNTSKLIISK